MSNDLRLLQVERNIAENKRLIELGKTLQRLESNPDYQKIINQGYMKDEAVRLVHLKADPAMQAEIRQTAIIKDIDAIGSLAGFIQQIKSQAELAGKSLADDEETRDELRAGY